jgi:hypothetical protein
VEKRQGVTENPKIHSGFRRVQQEQIQFPVVSSLKNAGAQHGETRASNFPLNIIREVELAHGNPIPDEAAGRKIKLPPVFLTTGISAHRVEMKNAGGLQHADRFPQKLRAIRTDDAVATMAVQNNVERIGGMPGQIENVARLEVRRQTRVARPFQWPIG